MSEPLIHLAVKPFVAVCGADVPNQRTTTVRGHVTCLHCLWPGGGRRMTEQRLTPEREAELRSDNGCTCCGEPQDAPVELLTELDAVRAEAAAMREALADQQQYHECCLARTKTPCYRAEHQDSLDTILPALSAEAGRALLERLEKAEADRDRLLAFVNELAGGKCAYLKPGDPRQCPEYSPAGWQWCWPCRARRLLEGQS